MFLIKQESLVVYNTGFKQKNIKIAQDEVQLRFGGLCKWFSISEYEWMNLKSM